MQLEFIFAVASTITFASASPLPKSLAEVLHRRQFPTSSADTSGFTTPGVADTSRADAFSTGATTYDSFINTSKAAAASGTTSSVFSSFVPGSGNPFALYYAGNPAGKASTAKTNNYGSTVAQVSAPPRGAPGGDQTSNLLSVMAQVDRTTPVV